MDCYRLEAPSPSAGPLGLLEPLTELRETHLWGYQTLKAVTKDMNRQVRSRAGLAQRRLGPHGAWGTRSAWVPLLWMVSEEEKDQKTVLLGLMETLSYSHN